MDERRVRSAARAVAGDFQTPLELARGVVRAVAETGVRPRAVLEPTCGKGAFLLAAREVFPRARLVGFDVNAEYVAEARRALGASARVEEADFFGVDWAAVLSELPAPVLVLGNPPWVTSATVSKLGGSNGPERTRRTGLVGLDAVTGASNFDISVWMLEVLGRAALTRGASLAVLCKAQVARKMVSFFHREGVHAEGDIWKLDARRHFGASVDAVAFAARPASPRGAGGVFAVRPDLVSAPVSRLGVRRGSLTGDVDAEGRTAFLERTNDGPDEPEWRSGIKHDAAKVMELHRVGETFVNGLGETVDLEPSHVLPLMKGSDVANRRAPGARALVVPQRALFDPTEALAESAPRTYTYLRRHEATLLARKSRIYAGRPAFSIFGVGPYAFAPYKVAVCGLYKRLAFHLVGPCDGQPVVFDDTITFLPFDDEASAARVAKALESPLAREFFEARVFWDEQRPLGKAVLQRLSLRALLEAENGPGDPFSLERHPKEP